MHISTVVIVSQPPVTVCHLFSNRTCALQEEAEADYKVKFPDHYAAFADLAPPDEADPGTHLQQQQQQDTMDLDQPAADGDEASDDAAAATAAQAKSAAAKSLLEGQLLQDVVALHHQLFSALAVHRLQHQLAPPPPPAAAAGGAATAGLGSATAGMLTEQQQLLVVGDAAREKAFTMCFSLGQQLVAAQHGLLPAAVDQLILPGSVMALALQHRALNTSAAATAAAAAAQPQQQQLDMQQPFPEEAFLMQQPLSDMSHRLIQLLEEWPEHPLLLQLLAIVERLLGLPLTVPLKQALTGLELLLARAQVWEETAAKHVSLKQQLAAVAGLATRWRKLELASWKGLLERVRARHASGASRSWYHLYQVLVLGTAGDSAAADAAAADAADADAAEGGDAADAAYRRTASLVEAFVQTSTVGEYAARLQLLQSFACQLTVTTAGNAATTAAAAAAPSSSGSQVASMLWNVLSYYTQFLPAVSAAIEAGLGPLSKELTDFVKLAKWEDRGYYAMKVSTEKAQRQLHRLSRRAEDYLKQPAAGVLASASQAMGLGQVVAPKAALAAAAAAGRAAGKAAKAAAATAAAAEAPNGAVVEAPPDQQQQQQQKERDAIAAAAAAAAEVDPALLAELDASDLTHGAAAAANGAAAFASSLDGFAAAALAAGGWQPAGIAAIAAAAAAGKGGRGKRGRKAAAAAAAAAGQLDVMAAPLIEALQQLQPHGQPAWAAFSAAVLQAAHDSSSGPADLHASSSSSSYAGRLPKLAARMARVLTPPELPAPAPAAVAPLAANLPDGSSNNSSTQQQQYEEQLLAALPALQLDDLAATAASRALSLSTDTTKGARLRKKKALTDLLHALGDAGFSKRASDVPASDRDAAVWFGQSQPCLASSPLLQPLQQSSSAAAAASLTTGLTAGLTAGAVDSVLLQLAGVCWSKADSYYFKSLARLQRLQAAAKAPHTDLARHEVLAVVGYSQHQLHLVRQQRLLLGDVAGSYTQLLQAVAWLQETASSSAAGAAVLLPPQEAARSTLAAARQQLCSLSYQLSAARQLVAAVIPMQQSSGQPQHVWKASASAAGKLASYIAAVDRHRAAVDSEWARISLAGCPVVSHAALAVAAAAFGELLQMQQDAETATAAIAATAAATTGEDAASSSSGSRAVVCTLVPAWDRVLDALDAAAAQASTLQQQANMQQHQQEAVDLQQCQQQFGACLDEVVAQVLLAAQALHSSSSSSTAHQQSAATAAAADAEQQGAAAGLSAAAAAAWSDALKPVRLSGLAASVRTLLSLLAQASNASQTPSDTAAAMAAQAAGLLPLLQLLLGGLQCSTCQLLLLHKSLAKLSYVCSSIFCSLTCEGYCMPEGQEGEAQEGTGEGDLQWQDAGGTGMGEGTGKKDVSDQIHDEDQLLGAQQKDQQQQKEEPPQQQQEDDEAEGVEMDGDFDGSLHDIDDRRQQQQGDDDDEEDEDGDDDRIDQKMGEVRDACRVLWVLVVSFCKLVVYVVPHTL
jgi:midasin